MYIPTMPKIGRVCSFFILISTSILRSERDIVRGLLKLYSLSDGIIYKYSFEMSIYMGCLSFKFIKNQIISFIAKSVNKIR